MVCKLKRELVNCRTLFERRFLKQINMSQLPSICFETIHHIFSIVFLKYVKMPSKCDNKGKNN